MESHQKFLGGGGGGEGGLKELEGGEHKTKNLMDIFLICTMWLISSPSINIYSICSCLVFNSNRHDTLLSLSSPKFKIAYQQHTTRSNPPTD